MIPAEIRKRLRFVEIESDRLDLERFPDFLIVGPQRTGTTWLHANLRIHPEVFLAEPKELFFFSRLGDRANPRFESAALDWYLSFFRDPWWRYAFKLWDCRRRCGALYRPRVRGEATASYAAMDRELIDEIAVLGPDTKIVFSIRDPIDRAWSHAKKDLARNRGRKLADVSTAEFEAFFAAPYQRRCARYEENLANWRAAFGPANVFLLSFEDIEREPEALLARVHAFLGVSSEARYVDASLARSAVNPTGASEVPDRIRALLEPLLAEDVAAWKRLVAETS